MRFRTQVLLGGKTATGLEVPEDVVTALDADPSARSAFEKLSYSHQRAHVLPINDAKTAETRQRRIQKSIEILRGD
jgi:uncharacterized protein YdeI (YjbR/CyaY-like superfamily)